MVFARFRRRHGNRKSLPVCQVECVGRLPFLPTLVSDFFTATECSRVAPVQIHAGHGLKYPITAQRAKKEGTVLVSFIINKDGTTTGHKIVRSAGAEFDGEALRVLRQMPKWTPGKDKGQPCRTYFCIPIVFKL